ncbi:TcpK family conjugal transfer DNA-binding protein [Clostridium perfringens]|uniref:TcpK family conjugal transfer DNA-binding protein n=1 Tax=Clostridium perfringens TaxID=1502 RepID=UPI003BAA51B7
MKDLNLYAKELVDVVNYLMKKGSFVFSRDRRYIYLNNEFIRDMLTKREYDTTENKLHMWRELKWLIADDEKLVKRVRIDDERVYAIVIDYSIFSWLKIQMEV